MALGDRGPGDDNKKAAAARPPPPAAGAYDADEHLLPVTDVAARYGTHVDPSHPDSSRGLPPASVAALRERWGRNALTLPRRMPEIFRLLLQFTNPLLLVLTLACVLTFLVYGIQSPRDAESLILASVMAGVIVVLALTSYWQERSAGNVMASLNKMMPSACTVVRGGAEEHIDAADLVPGDLVRLGIGDCIPSYGLKVEQSSLTGQSDLVPVSVDRRSDEALEARNLVFAGCLVMQGSGRAVVVCTGDRSMIGRIASLASSSSGGGGGNKGGGDKGGRGGDGNGNGGGVISGDGKTTLQIEIDRLVRFVGAVCVVVPTALFAIGAARRRLSVLDAFLNGFVLAVVACVLQGMRATVLSLLALCSMRLREKNVLIKHAAAPLPPPLPPPLPGGARPKPLYPPLSRKSPLLHQPAAVVKAHGSTALVVTGAELRELDAAAAAGGLSPAEHQARWDGMLAKLEIVFAPGDVARAEVADRRPPAVAPGRGRGGDGGRRQRRARAQARVDRRGHGQGGVGRRARRLRHPPPRRQL